MLKKGKCVNIGKPCSKALKKEIQEADNLNFICSECGLALVEIDKDKKEGDVSKSPQKPGGHRPPQKTFMQKYGAAIGIGAGVLAIAGGAAFLSNGDDETLPPPPPVKVEKIDLTDQVSLKKGESEQLTMTVEPMGAEDTYIWKSSDEQVATVDNQGLVTAVGKGKTQITVSLADNVAISDVCACEVTGETTTTPEEPKFPWGTYSGEMKNGKPHGTGKFVFTKKHVINSHDRKKRMANPGEYIQGQFVNGEITIGKHFAADGTLIQALNFGTGL